VPGDSVQDGELAPVGSGGLTPEQCRQDSVARDRRPLKQPINTWSLSSRPLYLLNPEQLVSMP